VVLYEISRGGLGSFTVDLPPGVAVEQAGTDEGEVIPVLESRRLTINRHNQLRGTGYLVLTSTPAPGAEVPLEPIVPVLPEMEVRARYLALASAVAADARPLPQASWSRVDLDDLPPVLREALSSIDLAAAWRLSGAPSGDKMAVSVLPLAPSLPLLVKRRETTTLLTVDGTLLHRDRLTLRPPGGLGAVLDVVLPATARLWSARVDEVPVRPLDRGNGTISIPLGYETGKEPVVEIVSVLEKAIPAGRSELSMTLPQIAVPVQAHEWRVLLPDGPKYRFRSGELRPAMARTDRVNAGGNEVAPKVVHGQVQDVITVTAESPLIDERRISTGATVSTAELEKIPTVRDPQALFAKEAKGLQQGLVGGVKPLPIAIPESGKVLFLTGALPPAKVGVELEVKGKERPQ
jgi:hypothetical protein